MPSSLQDNTKGIFLGVCARGDSIGKGGRDQSKDDRGSYKGKGKEFMNK